MSLQNISFQDDYRSGEDDILADFLQPCLRQAKDYFRAVGYFSSSALEAFGAPLGEFIRNGGRIRLITSVQLSVDDVRAIEKGISRREVCQARIMQIIDEQFADNIGDGVSRLVALLQIGRLELKIAIPKRGTGIFHEKVGIFFADTDYVAFSGSANESITAFENNYECVDVFPSWKTPERAARKRRHFEKLWNQEEAGVDVFPFPEAAARKLIEEYQVRQRGTSKYITEDKWRHQEEALEIFLRAERGILNMATGTGKTRTALKIIQSLFERNLIDTVIIATKGNDLLDQWYQQVLTVRKDLRLGLRVHRHYGESRGAQEFSLNPTQAILVTSREPLVFPLRELGHEEANRTLLIHDEVHGLGSPENRRRLQGLSDRIRFRLGLSATPDREYDQEGNDFIEAHVGPELMTFGLQEAIERGILAPFNYFPIPYQISSEDKEKISNIFARQAARAKMGNPMRDEEVWIEISRVYKNSKAKLPLFREFIKSRVSLLERCIIFVETKEYGDEVIDIIHEHRPDFHTYFANEDSETLRRFARGDLECLVTCHRLSEGIDIQSLSTVILFSSARTRLETIQRIGRCLRVDPRNTSKIANIVDFIRINEQPDEPNADDDRCAWLSALSKVRYKG